MRDINLVVLHCADTPDDSPHHFTVADIDSWHKQRGFFREPSARAAFNPELAAIGYHYVIYRDGTLHTGRAESEIGAHAHNFNAHSLGICMVGRRHFTSAQWVTLHVLLAELMERYPATEIKGHYQVTDEGKTCPNFDVPAYVAAGMQPAQSWIYS